MYPPYLQFSKENEEYEGGTFWYHDSTHHPQAEFPFATIMHEAWGVSIGSYNSRIFAVPPAYGFAQRILNGYLYITPVPVSSEKWMAERVPLFLKRAGHYYQNWDDLFARWKVKLDKVTADLRAIEVPELPRLENEAVVTDGVGISKGYRMLEAYNAVIDNLFLVYQYHFEMLNLGYAAYLNLFQFCQKAFPGIKDDTVAQMAAGADILFFRPDDELKKLAALAIKLGVADRIRGPGKPDHIVAELAQAGGAGKEWTDALEAAKDPWFMVSTGVGMCHDDPIWINDLTMPWAGLTSYIERLQRGENIERPTARVIERRDRITAEYRSLLPTDADRQAFDQNVGLARTVATYIEDHQVYVEHWHHTIWWGKIRQFGDRLRDHGMLEDREDLFYLNRWEVGQALYEMVLAWGAGGVPRGRKYWQKEVKDRRRILTALRAVAPNPILGKVPDQIAEPFTVMLFGITTEQLARWEAAGDSDKVVTGMAGSPGVAEGRARVILSPTKLNELEDGEILVCPLTAPTWGAVFGKIRAAVSDSGGVMSHAAIVSREYGLPAVVGTGKATRVIKTGDMVRVDGNAGTVTIL
jgi:pyruvate,water dikinase